MTIDPLDFKAAMGTLQTTDPLWNRCINVLPRLGKMVWLRRYGFFGVKLPILTYRKYQNYWEMGADIDYIRALDEWRYAGEEK